MFRRRATLPGMDRASIDRILAFVCDVIDRHAGDWDAIEAALLTEYAGDEEALEHAYAYAATLPHVYGDPGGPAFIRGMRDRRRRLVPAAPAGAPGRGLWPRRSA